MIYLALNPKFTDIKKWLELIQNNDSSFWCIRKNDLVPAVGSLVHVYQVKKRKYICTLEIIDIDEHPTYIKLESDLEDTLRRTKPNKNLIFRFNSINEVSIPKILTGNFLQSSVRIDVKTIANEYSEIIKDSSDPIQLEEYLDTEIGLRNVSDLVLNEIHKIVLEREDNE